MNTNESMWEKYGLGAARGVPVRRPDAGWAVAVPRRGTVRIYEGVFATRSAALAAAQRWRVQVLQAATGEMAARSRAWRALNPARAARCTRAMMRLLRAANLAAWAAMGEGVAA
jgi:hypothetical protein